MPRPQRLRELLRARIEAATAAASMRELVGEGRDVMHGREADDLVKHANHCEDASVSYAQWFDSGRARAIHHGAVLQRLV